MAKNKKRKKKAAISPRQERAKLTNEQKRKLLKFVNAAQLNDAYAAIPQFEIDLLLAVGAKTIKILPKEGQEMPAAYLMATKKIVHDCMKGMKFEVAEDSSVSLYDYYPLGELLTYRIRSKGYDFKNKAEVVKLATPYMQKVNGGEVPHNRMHKLAEIITANLCSPEFTYLMLEFGDYTTKGPLAFCYNCFYLSYEERQTVKVPINNIRRTVYRIGYPVVGNGIQWASVTPDKLNINCSIANLKVDVYIQQHALNRLNERLEGMQHRAIQLFLFVNVLGFEKTVNNDGQSLLQFNINDKKVGYLVYRYVEGIIVVTTFLLLTNNGTPEGEKLHELLGLDKEDKKYLGIDKLKTFINSDLKDDERALDIFTKAGCHDLFNLPPELMDTSDESEAIVDRFINYLELDKQESAVSIPEFAENTCD